MEKNVTVFMMRYCRLVIAVILVFSVSSMLWAQSSAPSEPQFPIDEESFFFELDSAPEYDSHTAQSLPFLVIDFQTVLRESDAYLAIQRQIDDMRQQFQEEFILREEELRNQEQELTALRLVLTEEEFVQRRREFEQEVAAIQRMVQDRRVALSVALDESVAQVHRLLVEIVAELAVEKNAQIVFDKDMVVMTIHALDVSAVALERLNSRLAHVEVDIPRNLPESLSLETQTHGIPDESESEGNSVEHE